MLYNFLVYIYYANNSNLYKKLIIMRRVFQQRRLSSWFPPFRAKARPHPFFLRSVSVQSRPREIVAAPAGRRGRLKSPETFERVNLIYRRSVTSDSCLEPFPDPRPLLSRRWDDEERGQGRCREKFANRRLYARNRCGILPGEFIIDFGV